MVAELAIRIVEQKKKEGIENIKLNIYPAQKALDNEYYENVVNSLLGVLKARQEFNFNLTINKITPIPAQDHYLLQIADLLSNASYKNYNKCNESTAKKLQNFFNKYDVPLIIALFSQRKELIL